MEGQSTELAAKAPTDNEISTPEKKSIAKKAGRFIKNRVVGYVRNLNPIGKDKFWWTGNLLSAAGTTALFFSNPALLPLRSLASAVLSVGTYAGEKAAERHREKNWTAEQLAERAAKRQEKFPNGISRLKRFILGISAGGAYAGILGIPFEMASPQGYHPIKTLKGRLHSVK